MQMLGLNKVNPRVAGRTVLLGQSIGTSTLGNNSLSLKANNYSTSTRIISTPSFRVVEFAGVHFRDFGGFLG
jgi:hypothetical protein